MKSTHWSLDSQLVNHSPPERYTSSPASIPTTSAQALPVVSYMTDPFWAIQRQKKPLGVLWSSMVIYSSGGHGYSISSTVAELSHSPVAKFHDSRTEIGDSLRILQPVFRLGSHLNPILKALSWLPPVISRGFKVPLDHRENTWHAQLAELM